MSTRKTLSRRCSSRGRTLRAWGATLALIVLPVGLCTGCDDGEKKAFLLAALDSFESGVKSILDGVVNGAVAAVEDEFGEDSQTTDPTSES